MVRAIDTGGYRRNCKPKRNGCALSTTLDRHTQAELRACKVSWNHLCTTVETVSRRGCRPCLQNRSIRESKLPSTRETHERDELALLVHPAVQARCFSRLGVMHRRIQVSRGGHRQDCWQRHAMQRSGCVSES